MRAGDDLFLLAGSSGDAQYLSHEERGALVAASVSHAKYFLECRLQNPTRVSIFNVTFYAGVSYHGGKQRTENTIRTRLKSLGPARLEPSGSRTRTTTR